MELQKSKKGHNLVTYFAWYMFNKWSLDEATLVFGFELGNHIYLKWEEVVRHGDGDQLRFYCNLDTVCRNKLVQRALDIYNSND